MAFKTFLHVGCGLSHKSQTSQGFDTPCWHEVRLDIDASVQPDVIGTMVNMTGVQDASMDAIFSSHNIEHLYPHEVGIALSEFLRVLKPDGFLVVTCPDLQSVCALVAEDKLTETAYMSSLGPISPLDILYGHRPSLNAGNLFMAHRCGFTRKVLVATLYAHGFAMAASMQRGRPYYDLWAVALKNPVHEGLLKKLADEHFPQ